MEELNQIVPASVDSDAGGQPGRLLAIDLGAKRVGIALSDEMRITARPLEVIERTSWKELLRQIAALIEEWSASGLVIGLPLSLDGTERSAADDARAIAEKFRRSLNVPVYLQDERLTTFAAESLMKAERNNRTSVDSEAAAIILRDFMEIESRRT
jgi:putative Holliday junction resolvase